MSLGVITGSGTHALPGFDGAVRLEVVTPYGAVAVTRGRFASVEALHVSRHGSGHPRLSGHVSHRANVWALHSLGVEAIVGCTACGAVDPTIELGSLIVFDDLHFLTNRLPDGSLCTFFDRPGEAGRGHWVLHGGPFSSEVRAALVDGARSAQVPVREGGVYGHVDGPRFNTPAEIAGLAACGVVAVSQTGGPETVLCGELEVPYALVGFATDYANGASPGEPTPVATLVTLMGQSTAMFAAVLSHALPVIATARARPAGTMLRFDA